MKKRILFIRLLNSWRFPHICFSLPRISEPGFFLLHFSTIKVTPFQAPLKCSPLLSQQRRSFIICLLIKVIPLCTVTVEAPTTAAAAATATTTTTTGVGSAVIKSHPKRNQRLLLGGGKKNNCSISLASPILGIINMRIIIYNHGIIIQHT